MDKSMEFNPDKMLCHKLRLASVGSDKFFRRMAEADPDYVPRGQGSLVGYVLHHPDQEIYQKDLEKVFHITGATASNMLKSLEKSGMIERVPSERDARLKRIIVTEKAYRREMRIHENMEKLEEAILRDFSEEEKVQVFAMLERIVHNIWELTEECGSECRQEQDVCGNTKQE